MLEGITEIAAEQLNVDVERVQPDSTFAEDLGADSLDLVEFVMALEEEYGLEIPDDDFDKIGTVREATEYLQARLPVS